MSLHGSVVISIYDETSHVLTMCCTICGAMQNADMSLFDDEEEGMAFEFEHEEGCLIGLVGLEMKN